MKMERNSLSVFFALFEKENYRVIEELAVYGVNTWSIVKYPLFLGAIQPEENIIDPAVRTLSLNVEKANKNNKSLLYGLFLLGKLFIKTTRNKDTTLFYTSSEDKPSKDINGRYFNFLTDTFISEKIISGYIYAEWTKDNNYKLPSFVKPDFRAEDLKGLASLYVRIFRCNQHIKQAASKLFECLKTYCEDKKSEIFFSEQRITDILVSFFADYRTSVILLKSCRAGFVISSETPGRGIIAAANFLKIKSLDLQHGVIDRVHPQYVFASSLKRVKDRMVLPSYIGVFGELHKAILCKEDFWSEEQIAVLGSGRVHMNREKYKTVKRDQVKVLIPTQWTAFKELQQLLQCLCAVDNSGYTVILKMHPLEPAENVTWFKDFAAKFNGRIVIEERSRDIYQLIAASLLVIGFDSAVLLESITLSVPSITIATETAPEGIHSMFNDDRLKKAIRIVRLDQETALPDLIERAISDGYFYKNWVHDAKEESAFLYASDYSDNCKRFMKTIFPAK